MALEPYARPQSATRTERIFEGSPADIPKAAVVREAYGFHQQFLLLEDRSRCERSLSEVGISAQTNLGHELYWMSRTGMPETPLP